MILLKWAWVMSVVLLLPGCSNRTEHAQDVLRSHLGEQLSLEFQNVEVFPGGAVCGEYRSNHHMWGSSRYRPFVVWNGTASERPSKQDRAIFCSGDAAAALRAAYGIGPVSDEENHLTQVRGNLRQLQSALEQYQADNSILPRPEQGLEALISAPTTPPLPTGFKAGGYIKSIPKDPWGRPYIYKSSRLGGRVAQQFELSTLGADGVRGGEGENADVTLEHLKYLDYLIPD